jgi:hypothetical protein
MQTDDDLRETLRRTAAELEQWSSETRARFDELKTRWEEQQRQFRFFSRNRDNFGECLSGYGSSCRKFGGFVRACVVQRWVSVTLGRKDKLC